MKAISRILFPFLGFALVSTVLRAQVAPVAATNADASRKALSGRRPETYGTTQPVEYVIDASELSPLSSGTQYAVANGSLRYLTNFSGLGFGAPIHLPSGAYVTSIEIDYFDNTTSGEVQASFLSCDIAGQTCNTASGNPGCDDAPVTVCSGIAQTTGFFHRAEDLSDDGITINNFYARYFVTAGNTTNDGSTAISQIRVTYYLQVSAPPSTATFADVPTSDPAFQYIEAVAASGITAGCGGGNFCPDSPITRRQMAVFLAKALGLQWD